MEEIFNFSMELYLYTKKTPNKLHKFLVDVLYVLNNNIKNRKKQLEGREQRMRK